MRTGTVLCLALFAVAAGVAPACSSSTDAADNGQPVGMLTGGAAGVGGAGGAAGKAGTSAKGGSAGGVGGVSGAGGGCGGGCPMGKCIGGACCDALHACGTICCGGADVCSFQKCVTPGTVCADEGECPAGDYCEFTLGPSSPAGGGGAAGKSGASGASGVAGVSGGAGKSGGGGASGAGGATCVGGKTPLSGKCLPKPPECAMGASGAGGQPSDPNAPITCIDKCEYHPPAGDFAADLVYTWGGQTTAPYATDVMMTPIVVELDDDDCNGKVDQNDIPDIAFTTFTGGDYVHNGTLHVISIIAGKVTDKWTVGGIAPNASLVGGNVDGKPGVEVVACGDDGSVKAFHGADGKMLWATAPKIGCGFPAVADLDGDGVPEIIVEGGILSGVDGTMKATFSAGYSGAFAVSDLDGDGKLDVVMGAKAFHGDGKLFVDTGLMGDFIGPAVADLDKDGKLEVIAEDYTTHTLAIWHYDPAAAMKFTMIRSGIDINGMLSPTLCPMGSAGAMGGGGPVTVGDFNGDGIPDVALAGGVGYVVFDGKKLMDPTVAAKDTVLWTKQSQDCSSAATGSSLFDFNGDGKAEVIYADEHRLRIYEGATGTVLFETCNTSGTLEEYPVVADVDNDGHADLIVVLNAYGQGPSISCADGSATAGVRIYGDKMGRWVRTRRVWNEHGYHVTNVEEDGTIPKAELPNVTQPGLDNFRQQKQPGGEFAAPDAIVFLLAPVCDGPYGLVATVRNIGEAVLPAGVSVGFYSGKMPNGTKLGTGATTVPLYPAQSEAVSIALPNADPAVKSGQIPVYAVVDDGGAPHPGWHECRTDNDTSGGVSANCVNPQ